MFQEKVYNFSQCQVNSNWFGEIIRQRIRGRVFRRLLDPVVAIEEPIRVKAISLKPGDPKRYNRERSPVIKAPVYHATRENIFWNCLKALISSAWLLLMVKSSQLWDVKGYSAH
jgi:hypothetical protein